MKGKRKLSSKFCCRALRVNNCNEAQKTARSNEHASIHQRSSVAFAAASSTKKLALNYGGKWRMIPSQKQGISRNLEELGKIIISVYAQKNDSLDGFEDEGMNTIAENTEHWVFLGGNQRVSIPRLSVEFRFLDAIPKARRVRLSGAN